MEKRPFVYARLEVKNISNVTEAVKEVLNRALFKDFLKENFLSSEGIISNKLLFQSTFYKDFLVYVLLAEHFASLLDIYSITNSDLFARVVELLESTFLRKIAGVSCLIEEEGNTLELRSSLGLLIQKISTHEAFKEYDFLLEATNLIFNIEGRQKRKPIEDLFSSNTELQQRSKAYFETLLSNIDNLSSQIPSSPSRKFLKLLKNRLGFLFSLQKCMVNESLFFIPLDHRFKLSRVLKLDENGKKLKELLKKLRLNKQVNQHALELLRSRFENLVVKQEDEEFRIKTELLKMIKSEDIRERLNLVTLLYNTKLFTSSLVLDGGDIKAIESIIDKVIKQKVRYHTAIRYRKTVPKQPERELRSFMRRLLVVSVLILVFSLVVIVSLVLELYGFEILKSNVIRDVVFYSTAFTLLVFLAVFITLHILQKRYFIDDLLFDLKARRMKDKIVRDARKELSSIVFEEVNETLLKRMTEQEVLKKFRDDKEFVSFFVSEFETEMLKSRGFVENDSLLESFDVYLDFRKNLESPSAIKQENLKKALKDEKVYKRLDLFDVHVKAKSKTVYPRQKVSPLLQRVTIYENIEDIESDTRAQIEKLIGSERVASPIIVHNRVEYSLPEYSGELKKYKTNSFLAVKRLIKDKMLRLVSFLNPLNLIGYFTYELDVEPLLGNLRKILEGKKILVHDFSFMGLSDMEEDPVTDIIHKFAYKTLKSDFFLTRMHSIGFYVPEFFKGGVGNKIKKLVKNYIINEVRDLSLRSFFLDVFAGGGHKVSFTTCYILNLLNSIPIGSESNYYRVQMTVRLQDLIYNMFKVISQIFELNRSSKLIYEIQFRPFSKDINKSFFIVLEDANGHTFVLKFRKVSLAISVVSGVILISLLIDFNIRNKVKIPNYAYIVYYSLLVAVFFVLLMVNAANFTRSKRVSQVSVITDRAEVLEVSQKRIKAEYTDILKNYFFIYKHIYSNILGSNISMDITQEEKDLLLRSRSSAIVERFLKPIFITQCYFLIRDHNFVYGLSGFESLFLLFKKMFFGAIEDYSFYRNI